MPIADRENRRDPLAWGLALGYVLAAPLLLRLVIDLARGEVVFGLLAVSFYVGFLVLEFLLVRAAWSPAPRPVELPRARRIALGLAVPLGLLGSTLDCMGLSLEGCTSVCTLLTKGLAPVISALALLAATTGSPGWLRASVALSFGLLVPNCVCRNPVNSFWIDLLGYSPACCISGFTVALVAASALHTRRHATAALVFTGGTIAVLFGFFVGHHYYDWPW